MRASVDNGQPLGDRRVHLERPAGARRGRGLAGHVSRGVPAGHGGPRGDPRRHRRESSRSLGRGSCQPGPARHRDPLRPRRRGTRALPGRAREARRAAATAWKCSRRSIWRRRRRSTMRTITSAIATGSRSRSSKEPARSRRPAPARRSRRASSSSAIRTKTARRSNQPQPEILSRNGSFMAYRRLEEHVGAFRDFLRRARPDAGGAGTGRREADGPLAQRRAARARAGQGRPGARRRSAAEQRLQLQADGPARLCGAARLAHPAHESARHRRRT